MEYKDYYKILGVERNAGENEIKRSYRKLAMQYHPDRNPGDSKAEEKFKEINEAYQVLGDPEKRARYNQLGESYSRWQQSGRSPGGFNWDEWYTTAPGGNVRVEVGNFEDLFGGGGLGDFSEFFRRVFGGMGRADFERGAYSGAYSGTRGGARPDSRYATPDIQHEIEITLSEAFHGTTRRLEVDGRRLEVKIPRGARTGTKIRVANAVTDRDGQRSDLYLVVKLANDPNFERKGNDLYTDVSIDLYKAVLGGEVTVRTLAGNLVLTIPAGTQPGQSIRLAGQGMPYIKNPDQRGDLFVRVKVKIPRNITPEQRELFKKLEQLG